MPWVKIGSKRGRLKRMSTPISNGIERVTKWYILLKLHIANKGETQKGLCKQHEKSAIFEIWTGSNRSNSISMESSYKSIILLGS